MQSTVNVMNSIFLDREEICRITCRKKSSAQIRKLMQLGIPHLVDGDGWPLVLKEQIIGKQITAQIHKPTEPDFEAAFGKKGR